MNNTPRSFIRHLPALSLLVIVTALAYRDIFHQAFLINWDDKLYVTANAAAQGFSIDHLKQAFSSFYVGNYAPLHIISYMLDYEIWGAWAGGYKLTNLILHIGNGLLLYLLLIRFFGASRLAAFCGTFLFLCHPVQVESVAWISQRKTVLSTLFMLISFLAYLQSFTVAATRHGRLWRILSLSAFAAALLAKAVCVILPLVMLCYEALVRRRVTIMDKAFFALAALAVAAVTLVSQSPENHGGIIPYHGGSPYATFLTMLTVLPRYLYNIVWPLHLAAFYSPPIKTAIDSEVIAGAVLAVGLAGIGIYIFRSKPLQAFWYLLFFIALLPVSQIVPITTLMNDRYLYIPFLGLAGIAACTVHYIQRLHSPSLRTTIIAGFIAVLIPLPWLSYKQTSVWQDTVSLWNAATDASPRSSEAWTGLGSAYQDQNKPYAALSAYLYSLRLEPGNDISLNNISLLYLTMGKLDNAEKFAHLLLNVDKSAGSYTTLAMIYYAKKQYDLAEKQVTHALIKDPKLETALTLMGSIATEQGSYIKAEQFLNRSLELHGPIGPILIAMASLEAARGRQEAAEKLLLRALEAGYQDGKALVEDRHLAPLLNKESVRAAVSRKISGALEK